MSIRFDCPSCHKKVVVHDRFANRQMRCPSCELQLRVPTHAELDEIVVAEAAPEEIEIAEAVPVDSAEAVLVDTLPLGAEPDGNASVAVAQPEMLPPKSRRQKSIKQEHAKEEEDLEWDITPMVDVAFLLLIFFMLTASFSIQKAIPTTAEQKEQPGTSTNTDPNEKDLDNFIIQIDEYNGYTVISNDFGTQQASSKQELIGILKDLKTQMGDAQPRVINQAHVDSLHGAVVACMDAAREAEFSKFQMQSVEEFD